MEFLAPAKINLTLRVLRKREDGFHEIESLMAPISIFDSLEIELTETGGLQFSCSDPMLVSSENLVVRATRLFCESFGFVPNVRIALKKEIPSGAGLGGGSSDAATTLLALDHLFQTQLPKEELVQLASELGSDVPFFIGPTAAWCRGRGEIVEPTTLAPPLPLLLLKPAFSVPTPWAYQRWQDSKEIPGVSYAPQKFEGLELVNDLERPVFEKYLQLAQIKHWLMEQPETAGALMSGSGATVFALLHDKAEGMALAGRAEVEFGRQCWLGLAETV